MPNKVFNADKSTLHKHVVRYAHFTTYLFHSALPVNTALCGIEICFIAQDWIQFMKVKRSVLLLASSYLMFFGFYVGAFFHESLPEVDHEILLLALIPYLGFGAFVWSLYFGVGVVVLGANVFLSFRYFKSGNYLNLIGNVFVGVVGGFAFNSLT